MCYCGVVMVCGFVVGMDFFVIVVLFILCGVMFVGIDSVMCLCVEWLEVWCWFVFDFDVEKLGVIGYQVGLSDVILLVVELIDGKVCGCIVVDVNV